MANKIGRPTKYKPEYCDMIIEHMEGGLSIESFAAVVEVSKQTLYDWMAAHPEFIDSVKIGTEKSRLFWEKTGIKGLFNRSTPGVSSESFNATVWIFNMKNRFRDEWTDKTEVEQVNINADITPTEEEAKKISKSIFKDI